MWTNESFIDVKSIKQIFRKNTLLLKIKYWKFNICFFFNVPKVPFQVELIAKLQALILYQFRFGYRTWTCCLLFKYLVKIIESVGREHCLDIWEDKDWWGWLWTKRWSKILGNLKAGCNHYSWVILTKRRKAHLSD